MSFSSSTEPHYASSYHTGNSNVVDSIPTLQPHCEVLVTGGGVDDIGVIFKIRYETPFDMVYVHCAYRLGKKPSQLRLFYRCKYVSPDHTPFGLGMNAVDIVLLYAKDCITGLRIGHPLDPNPTYDSRHFVVQDCRTIPTVTRYNLKKSTLVANLCMAWGRTQHVSGERVTMYMDGEPLNGSLTIQDAQIYDGAVLYGVIN